MHDNSCAHFPLEIVILSLISAWVSLVNLTVLLIGLLWAEGNRILPTLSPYTTTLLRSMPCHPRLALLSPHRRWRASSRLSPRPQRVNLHVSFQVCGQGCGRSLYCEAESQAVEALDLPTPTYFRSRSHSYLRAIQAGCSQDEDTASVDSDSPPPTTTGCTHISSTSEYTVLFSMGVGTGDWTDKAFMPLL